jgi:hypothetical protein
MSVRVLAVCILGPSVAFLSVIAVGAIVQSANNWPSTVVVAVMACVIALVLINALTNGISTQNGMLVIHGLRRKQMPLSAIAELRKTPSKYPGLQLLGFIGTDGQILCQLLPIWDVNTVASWAARVGIQFVGDSPKGARR